MTAPQAFRDLATVIEGFDAAEISVDGVRTNEERSADEGSLTAELTARIPWDASTDLDEAVSFSLPDGTDVDSTDRKLTVPLRVEIGADADREADGGDALGAVADEGAGAAKTQVTDGGVRAPVKTDGAASPATGRTDRTSEPRDESRSGSEEDAQIGTENAAADTGRVAAESANEDVDTSASTNEDADDENVDVENANNESADNESADDEPATPPHRDPERLREVYESRETFAEMTEALGASVTPQTVRNQMIRRGIHEPNRRRGSGAEDGAEATECGASDGESESETNEQTDGRSDSSEDESTDETASSERGDDDPEREEQTEREEEADREPTAESDEEPTEVDLPSHVTLDDVREAVVEATTLYEVQRELRTDRTKTRKLLQQLDLLDLVTGRIATADGRKGAVDEIDERIRRARA